MAGDNIPETPNEARHLLGELVLDPDQAGARESQVDLETIGAVATTDSVEFGEPALATPEHRLAHAQQKILKLVQAHRILVVDYYHLPPREKQVAEALARGLSNKEIAAQLYITEGTAKTNLRKTFGRMGVTRREELIRVFNGLPVSSAQASKVKIEVETQPNKPKMLWAIEAPPTAWEAIHRYLQTVNAHLQSMGATVTHIALNQYSNSSESQTISESQRVIQAHVLAYRTMLVDYCRLTKRELEVVQWTTEGLSNQQIGRKLKIDEGTVKSHLLRIKDALGTNGRREQAIQIYNGLEPLPSAAKKILGEPDE